MNKRTDKLVNVVLVSFLPLDGTQPKITCVSLKYIHSKISRIIRSVPKILQNTDLADERSDGNSTSSNTSSSPLFQSYKKRNRVSSLPGDLREIIIAGKFEGGRVCSLPVLMETTRLSHSQIVGIDRHARPWMAGHPAEGAHSSRQPHPFATSPCSAVGVVFERSLVGCRVKYYRLKFAFLIELLL